MDEKGTSSNAKSNHDKPCLSFLSFSKMTVSLQTFAISKRLELETSAWSQIKDLFKKFKTLFLVFNLLFRKPRYDAEKVYEII